MEIVVIEWYIREVKANILAKLLFIVMIPLEQLEIIGEILLHLYLQYLVSLEKVYDQSQVN